MAGAERFTIGADVRCTDGTCGTLSRVVVDPVAREATHLLVQPRQGHEPVRLVPLGLVSSAAGEVRLSCTSAEFDRLDPGQETRFIAGDADVPDYRPGDIVFWPHYGYRGARGDLVTSDTIPVGEVEVYRGEHVHATDGTIGRVEGLVIDPQSGHVTHVLLQKGHLGGHQGAAIPISAVTRAEDRIEVSLTRQQVRDLPPVNVDQPHGWVATGERSS
jgi:sporulation protein YlmC with PRC-barrel domain